MNLKKIIPFLLIGVLVLLSACGPKFLPGDEETASNTESADYDAGATTEATYYDQVLADILDETITPLDIDYDNFRRSFFENYRDFEYDVDQYTAYTTEFDAAYIGGDTEGALDALNKWIAIDFTDTDTHWALGNLYYEQEYIADAEFHWDFAQGLIDSILATGDGESIDTAYHVLSPHDEFAVLNYFEYEEIEADTVDDGYVVYDWVDVKTTDGDEKTVYFNVTEVADRLAELY
ncbi:MAG: DUF4919 domain-containing protein [bacterium]|nr:DUF4919 domain-containing protein [bacterium]